MFFLFKNYSLVEVIYAVRPKKTQSFLENTKKIDKNIINEHILQTERKLTLEKVSVSQ